MILPPPCEDLKVFWSFKRPAEFNYITKKKNIGMHPSYLKRPLGEGWDTHFAGRQSIQGQQI